MSDASYLVTGDLHIDKHQYGLTIRNQDNIRCIEAVLAEALANPNHRGIILTGDIFNKRSILPRFQLIVRDLYQKCRQADKELLAIDGNHDASDVSWMDTIAPEINQNRKTRLLGKTKAAFFSYQERIALYAELSKCTDCKLIFLHGKLLELMPWIKASPTENNNHEFSAVDLREMGFKDTTFLLGDIHTYCDYHDPVGNNWFVYSGSTEMTDLNEGNSLSHKFGEHYSAQKKMVLLHPDRAPGENWELKALPNRPYWRRIVDASENPAEVITQLSQWVTENPQGILALHYPQKFAADLQEGVAQWRARLLLLFDTVLYPSISKQLQDLRETDILEIAKEDLTERQVHLLGIVLGLEDFIPAVKATLQATQAVNLPV